MEAAVVPAGSPSWRRPLWRSQCLRARRCCLHSSGPPRAGERGGGGLSGDRPSFRRRGCPGGCGRGAADLPVWYLEAARTGVLKFRVFNPGPIAGGWKEAPRKEVRGTRRAPLACPPPPLWVCFLLLVVFPWLAPRKPRLWGVWDGLGVRGAQGPGRAAAAKGSGGHDPDNPLCLTVTTGPVRTRVAAVAFAREGKGLQRGGNGGWRRREAGRASGSLLPAMTLTPSFSLPAFEFALFPSQPSSSLPLSPPNVGPPPLPLALQNGHAICKGVAMHFPKSPVQLASPWAPSSHQAHTITVPPGAPHQAARPGHSDTAPGGSQRCGLQETPALRSGRSRRFPVPAGDRRVRVCAFAPAAWITLLFLSGLLFAADGGEHGAGRAAWGMGAEGSWTPINPEKKKFGRATSRVEGQEGAAGWRECAVR